MPSLEEFTAQEIGYWSVVPCGLDEKVSKSPSHSGNSPSEVKVMLFVSPILIHPDPPIENSQSESRARSTAEGEHSSNRRTRGAAFVPSTAHVHT